MQGAPTLGRTAQITVTKALGGTLDVLGLSLLSPQVSPFAGGTIWLQQPLVTDAFLTSGNPGAGGVGAAMQSLVVPNNAALAGVSVTAHAVILDPAANLGLALSNAIEIWLR